MIADSYEQYKNDIKGKVILVTGGTGSFGNAVISGLLKFEPQRIIIFSRDEKKQHDMRNEYNSPLLKFIIGDVREKESLEKIMDGVDYVFHAAALKQVPSCEFFPLEAIKTNILGAHNVISTAIRYKVERLVILSTDKAVYPINAMGLTKALMEKVMIADARKVSEDNNTRTTLCGTRYGNVLYTRGSVIPLFVELIKRGEVLTVTNPDMTRFLLPLSESVDLVLHAMTNGKNGDMYVRKAPATTIETLAQAVCEVFKYKKGYRVVGIRAGEKMHEVLVSQEEMIRAQDDGDYFRIPPESQGLDYQKYYEVGKKGDVEKVEPFTSENTKRLDLGQTVKLLLSLPEIKEELALFRSS
ncbi:MAG: UDP-glucose 4-epimerase [Candidatus Blackburnbacteria bacterium RIFCSPHIGHO2_01_FULL_44_64]|uniref:UDP-glucose 4-epimerase n=1 Tax=Candidatus Blackburnbacteria bacterium RIFCSPHIGHO2_02_FULL_44_20 TaxID=1797516 RepID=A0A1G1V9E1_9BACT|nr:MAG: UDP-glucose 4-epimerase [Candidatus Blackburnbacteria bacterium RIFCSPHIGHO2_01_FULL_44_64]OGY10302.1 MAG: UDP-glucose 4-epimerase [Candidatus Blackburnbacteria bacterium RIFCSPHIGHO2_12_FULL_44_25]OGY11983.1 MAG: UDP-glucose 4-epimerase [Candidatus Blackburnbacteria bacterium RIFCSPHIGHO2_02_FULL_44_20]OGY14650.1 MAG: UDP-glucose 4-epimerase [Candidatus Blackburnbacteria bacterium RIFCSPLOWO2_01_FULL_44_43]